MVVYLSFDARPVACSSVTATKRRAPELQLDDVKGRTLNALPASTRVQTEMCHKTEVIREIIIATNIERRAERDLIRERQEPTL